MTTPMIKDHAIIILASGLSQRLGQSKQLLSKNGEALICYMTKLALATQPNAVAVVIPQEQPAIADIISELARQKLTTVIVVNPIPQTGMAHSLYLGVEALANFDKTSIKRVLIMGIDQVLLDKCHLTNLLAGTHPVVASCYQHLNENCLNETFSIDEFRGNIVGLPIAIDYELLKEWQSALVGDKGLRHLIRSLPSNQISTIINQQLSYDIDTPKQLAYARQQRWLDN